MALTDYTDYDSIRAALGVSAKDLSDTALAVDYYLHELEQSLLELNADILTDYSTATGESTTASANFVRAVRLYSANFVAGLCSGVSANLIAKSITNGRGGFSRQTEKVQLKAIQALLDKVRASQVRLRSAYAVYSPSSGVSTVTVPPTFLAVSELDTDPVTGS